MLRTVVVLGGAVMHVLKPARLLGLTFGLHTENINCSSMSERLDDERDGAVASNDVQILGLDPDRDKP